MLSGFSREFVVVRHLFVRIPQCTLDPTTYMNHKQTLRLDLQIGPRRFPLHDSNLRSSRHPEADFRYPCDIENRLQSFLFLLVLYHSPMEFSGVLAFVIAPSVDLSVFVHHGSGIRFEMKSESAAREFFLFGDIRFAHSGTA